MLKGVNLKNPHLNKMPSDFLYHLNINVPNTADTSVIQKQFGDIVAVCAGGTSKRMRELAIYLRPILGIKDDSEPVDLCESGQRYAVYKVGPVLCVSHGVGSSTFSVVLHELLKLVKYAKCQDPVFIRIGTCGGVGVEPGTVVITKDAYNGYLKNEHEIPILGKRVVRPASFPDTLCQEILKYGAKSDDGFNTIIANTMSTDCFYEGQGRTDGAVCEYSDDEKMAFLKECQKKGICNIEMEATMFASLTQKVGVRAADVCVTLINRLNGDQVSITMHEKETFEQRPFSIVGRYIQHLLLN
ncbi:uridine phosphorylase 1 [Drosophila virilis]|uniref:uridine phosphorylase 1 n=1 Tax=Drosophila virilis TaxID=7244 RepID=UPI001395EA83|nr:uridine phosphorylase 1 [Drosophila virilis]XP_015027616.2 uridine phosphorylase 1 [Drosophila virilis]XP_015027617.2 uridine phosphorylase 1 [Drosophila virilis]XP_015027618.2 uridine phosphorylase 1 [Drosophila virilis]XP_015027619.2 uridine phosphorylase 1 [Drosophila virilis]XP_015027620.2 uridine phosphorylase 1 [Drosophila virilis]